MHIWTHLRPEAQGATGLGIYPDGMVEHDGHVGQLLRKLDELGIAKDTIVVYSTDNGAEAMSWPDGGTTPFRGEKNTNWEGGYRVPTAIRWPGVIRPGSVYNDVFSHEDVLPTLLAAAGDPNVKEKLLKGHTAAGKTFKVHLDGHNLLPYLSGQAEKSPRRGFFYFNDDGDLVALRFENWKTVFMEQRKPGTLAVWAEPFTALRMPHFKYVRWSYGDEELYDLRADPYEQADVTSNTYYQWLMEQGYILFASSVIAEQFLQTFKEFPPSQRAATFTIDQAMEKMRQNLGTQ
jgi:arylsulfatase